MSIKKDPLADASTNSEQDEVSASTVLGLPVVYPKPGIGGLSDFLVADQQSDPVVVTYQFKDHKGNRQTVEFKWDKAPLFELIQRHGVTREIQSRWKESHSLTREEQATLKLELMEQAPYYTFSGDFLTPPRGTPWSKIETDRLIAEHATYCKDIAERLVELLDTYRTDTPLERAELAMCFVGQIPYGIPVHQDESRNFDGFLTPAGCLVHRFADCDSKRYLLAGILAHLIEDLDLRWVYAPGHGYDVVGWDDPEPGMDVLSDEKGTKLVVADATTPRRFGEPNGYLADSKVNDSFIVPSTAVALARRSHSATTELYYHRRYPTLVGELEELRSSRTTIRRATFDSGPGWVVLGGDDKASQDVRSHGVWAPVTNAFVRDYSQVHKGTHNEYFLQLLESSGAGKLKLGRLSGSPAFSDLVREFDAIVGSSALSVRHVSCGPVSFEDDPVTQQKTFKFPFVLVHGTDATACTHGFLNPYERDLQGRWGEGYTGVAEALESERVHGLRCVVLSRFGWVVLSGNNQPKMSLTPCLAQPISQMCQRIASQGSAIQHIAISEAGDWIILYGKNCYALSWGGADQALMADS